MLFASNGLAARIEGAECRLVTDGAAAVARRRGSTDGFVVPIAGGVAAFTVPDSPLNKVAGLGFAGPLDERELADVERRFAQREAAVQVELSCLADASIAPLLTRSGYVLQGFENVLGRTLSPASAPTAAGDLDIAVSGAGELETWIEVMLTGFAAADTQGVPSHESFSREAMAEICRDLAGDPAYVRYLARRGGTPIAAGGMRRSGNVAQLCGAATLPAHRRRGAQRELLGRRLADASAAGCDIAVITALPGSKSQANAQRQGFALLYTRAILVRTP